MMTTENSDDMVPMGKFSEAVRILEEALVYPDRKLFYTEERIRKALEMLKKGIEQQCAFAQEWLDRATGADANA
jgi:hypothetical protein